MAHATGVVSIVFFFNDTATTEIYTLSLHDALPICLRPRQRTEAPGLHRRGGRALGGGPPPPGLRRRLRERIRRSRDRDRKSTRLNSSHANISYAVFCLKKKKSN